jgi:predicted O-methyltransferase YrrM
MPDQATASQTREETWTAVDNYFTSLFVGADPALDAALAANAAADLPSIDVAPSQGKLLHLLARMQQARRILEIGTLGGYSTIWLARALPADGRLITMEFEPKHAAVAKSNIDRAGLSDRVEIRVGAALDSLAQLATENPAPFDMIFIDADKPNNPVYLEWAMKLSRRGTVLIVDNVIREGKIVDGATKDASVVGTRAMFAEIARLQQAGLLTATAIQTVGSKGYDGLCIAIVR